MTTALIVGGGIAGTATAIALRTVGVSSVICEAYPSGGEDTGAFLTVMHNGMAALHQIEADRAVIDASHPANGVSLLDASGSQLEQRRIDPPGRTLTRAALYRVLQDEAARRGVRIDRGRRLVDATAGDGGVRASFADGSAAQGDLLVGADGLHSVVRGLIDPDAPRPRYTGQHVIYGYATGGRGTPLPTPITWCVRQPGILRIHDAAGRSDLVVRPARRHRIDTADAARALAAPRAGRVSRRFRTGRGDRRGDW